MRHGGTKYELIRMDYPSSNGLPLRESTGEEFVPGANHQVLRVEGTFGTK